MAMLGLDGIKKYASADTVQGEEDSVLKENRHRYIENSKHSFVWTEISKWSSKVFGGIISGLSIAVASSLFAGSGGAGAVAGLGIPILSGIVIASAVIGIGAAYVAHQITSSNRLNANEINSQQTGKYIKAALGSGKGQDVEQSEAIYHNVVVDEPSDRQSSHLLFDRTQNPDSPQHKIQTHQHDVSKAMPIAMEIEPLSSAR